MRSIKRKQELPVASYQLPVRSQLATGNWQLATCSLRPAFTIAELTISMIVISMILLAVGSSITVSLRAAERNRNTSDPANLATIGQSAVEQLQADLRVATSIANASATGCTLTVPDRTGDGNAETIIYSWAGAGSPLMRQFNSQPAISIADNVQNLNLSYLTRTVGPPPPSESAEQTLIAQNSLLYSSNALTTTNWAAEFVRPSLPSNAVSWKITHVQVQCHGNSSSILTVKIEPVDASGVPMGGSLGSASLSASSIPKNGDATLDFKFPTPISGLSPNQGYCIVISSSGTGTGVDKALISLASTSWMTTANSGSTWTAPSTLTAMQFTLYGTVTTQN